MYLNILNESTLAFKRDSFFNGLLMGLGLFAVYCSSATVFHYSYEFIADRSLSLTCCKETGFCTHACLIACPHRDRRLWWGELRDPYEDRELQANPADRRCEPPFPYVHCNSQDARDRLVRVECP